MVFSAIVNNIIEVCSADAARLCTNATIVPDRPYYMDKLGPLTCYAQNYFGEAPDCRERLDELIINVIPCASEGTKYCSDVTTADDKMSCLNSTLTANVNDEQTDVSVFSTGCKELVKTWADNYAIVSASTNGSTDSGDKKIHRTKSSDWESYNSDDDVISKAMKGTHKESVGSPTTTSSILLFSFLLTNIHSCRCCVCIYDFQLLSYEMPLGIVVFFLLFLCRFNGSLRPVWIDRKQ